MVALAATAVHALEDDEQAVAALGVEHALQVAEVVLEPIELADAAVLVAEEVSFAIRAVVGELYFGSGPDAVDFHSGMGAIL